MGYKHLNTTPETESGEIIKSGVEELVPVPSECEVTSKDKNECDVFVCKYSSTFDVCEDHYEILSDSNNDDISSDDDAFEDIEYVEASVPDSEIVSLEEENVEEEDVDLEDIFQIQDVVLREKLLSINRLIANIESLNDNPTPDRMLNSSTSIPIFEESDNSLLDNFSPEFKTFSDHTEEMRSEVDLFLASDNSIPPGIKNFNYDSEGDIRFFEELLIDDSILFPNNESFAFEDDPSFPRPPPEPPDVEFCFDLEPDLISDVIAEEISDKLIDDECFDPGEEIDVFANNEDDDYFPFIFVIRIFLPYLIYPEFGEALRFLALRHVILREDTSKPSNIGHKIGSLHQKPDQREFFYNTQANEAKCQKIESSRVILAIYPNSKIKGKEKIKVQGLLLQISQSDDPGTKSANRGNLYYKWAIKPDGPVLPLWKLIYKGNSVSSLIKPQRPKLPILQTTPSQTHSQNHFTPELPALFHFTIHHSSQHFPCAQPYIIILLPHPRSPHATDPLSQLLK
nr:hypothetical protein [Tanacetum cinerariifolium]